MADITLISGANPADYSIGSGSEITIKNGVKDSAGTEVGTTLSCDAGLFTPASSYPMALTAGQEVTVQVGASSKDYYYVDPTKPGQGTRTGRINP